MAPSGFEHRFSRFQEIPDHLVIIVVVSTEVISSGIPLGIGFVLTQPQYDWLLWGWFRPHMPYDRPSPVGLI